MNGTPGIHMRIDMVWLILSEWLKSGKIPHIDNEKRTVRLELSEYQRLTGG